MQRFIRDVAAGKQIVVIKEVQLFLDRQRDARMALQIIIQSRRARFLRARNEEIEFRNRPLAETEHGESNLRRNRRYSIACEVEQFQNLAA